MSGLYQVFRFLRIAVNLPEVLTMVKSWYFISLYDPLGPESRLKLETRNGLRDSLQFVLSRMPNLDSFTSHAPAIVDIFLASAHPKITTLSLHCFDSSLRTIPTAFPLLVDLDLYVEPSASPEHYSSLTSRSMIVPSRRQLQLFKFDCAHTCPALLDLVEAIQSSEVELAASESALGAILAAMDPTVEHLDFPFSDESDSFFTPLAAHLFTRFTSLRSLFFALHVLELNDTFFVDLFRSALPLQCLYVSQFTGYNANDLLTALALPHHLTRLFITFDLDPDDLSEDNWAEELESMTLPEFTPRCPLPTIKLITDCARGRGVVVDEDFEKTQAFMSKWEAAVLAAQD